MSRVLNQQPPILDYKISEMASTLRNSLGLPWLNQHSNFKNFLDLVEQHKLLQKTDQELCLLEANLEIDIEYCVKLYLSYLKPLVEEIITSYTNTNNRQEKWAKNLKNRSDKLIYAINCKEVNTAKRSFISVGILIKQELGDTDKNMKELLINLEGVIS
jgi:hypothetical protein